MSARPAPAARWSRRWWGAASPYLVTNNCFVHRSFKSRSIRDADKLLQSATMTLEWCAAPCETCVNMQDAAPRRLILN